MARGRSILPLCFRYTSGFASDSELLESQRSYVRSEILYEIRDPLWGQRFYVAGEGCLMGDVSQAGPFHPMPPSVSIAFLCS